MENNLEEISFAEWLIRLNRVAKWAGYKGRPIVEITGQFEWWHFYETGMHPANALESAENDGAMFGADYCD